MHATSLISSWRQASAPTRRALLAVLAAAAMTLVASPASRAQSVAPTVRAPQVDSPKRVLFVGNSYFHYGDSLHPHVRRMADAAGIAPLKSPQYKSSSIGGSRVKHHAIDWLTTPGQIGVKEPFELVILQGGSMEPLSPKNVEGFKEAVADANKLIQSRGGKVALYMTHAYVSGHKDYKPENIRLTEDMYVKTGNQIGALVIPVGLAFEEAYRRHPEMVLHKSDATHPSLIGTYLAACTVLASVYGKSPVGNPYDYEGAIDPATKAKLQQVAQDTVERFYRR